MKLVIASELAGKILIHEPNQLFGITPDHLRAFRAVKSQLEAGPHVFIPLGGDFLMKLFDAKVMHESKLRIKF